jgi:nanoRNase/pAp phosphatase (c-di-AMP/oligoRNAs hydrolase)
MANVRDLIQLLRSAPDEVFLQPHNVPDPDAIASCFGLKRLLDAHGVHAQIVYEDEIEKANSKKMLDVFGIEMRLAAAVKTLGAEDWGVLVDVQKGNANVTDLVTDEVACIDHHNFNGFSDYRYQDVRPDTGACASIIASYFVDTETPFDQSVATALIYGIMMDTGYLTRGVSSLDIDMFYRLYHEIDPGAISELKANQISTDDLSSYAKAFRTVEVYDNIGFLRLESPSDSLLGTASDIVQTIAGVDIVVSYSVRDHGVKYSVRSVDAAVSAGDLVRHIVEDHGVGGGHDHMAGGFIDLTQFPELRSIDTFSRYRTIRYVEAAG